MRRGFHLPASAERALRATRPLGLATIELGRVSIEQLEIDPPLLSTLAGELRRRRRELIPGRDALAPESIRARLAGLAELGRRVADPGSGLRHDLLEAVPGITGFSAEMVAILLDTLAAMLQQEPSLDVRALPSCRAASRFVPFARGYARYFAPAGLSVARAAAALGLGDRPYPLLSLARRPELVTSVAAGNVPGIGVMDVVFSAMIGAAALVKTSAAEPYLSCRLLQELSAIEARGGLFPLSELAAVVCFPGGDWRLTGALIDCGDHLTATGGRGSKRPILSAVRSRRWRGWRGLARRVSGHWHKVSFDLVGHELLEGDWLDLVAEGVAMDNSMLNTQGCVSAQQVFVEGTDEEVLRFGERLRDAMRALLVPLPKGAAACEGMREMYERAEAQGLRILTPLRELEKEPVFVACDLEPRTFAAFNALNRSILVRRIRGLEQLSALLRPVPKDLLQSCGVAIPTPRLLPAAEVLGRAGVNRVVGAGDIWNMQPGVDSWDGYLPPLDLLAPQAGAWTTLSFRDTEAELPAIQARNHILVSG